MNFKHVLAGLAAVSMMAPAAIAGGNEQSGFMVGDCISDGLFGNEPNMANGSPGGPAEQEPGTQAGNVVPTQSPGPFVNNPLDPDSPIRGRSVGGFMQDGIDVPEICRTLDSAAG